VKVKCTLRLAKKGRQPRRERRQKDDIAAIDAEYKRLVGDEGYRGRDGFGRRNAKKS
jgi:hypothetical protein